MTKSCIEPLVLYFQEIQDAFGCLATFKDGGYHQIRTAHHITTGEHFRIGGLELEFVISWSFDSTPVINADVELTEPVSGAGLETERNQYMVALQDFFSTRNGYRAATATLLK